MFQIKKNNLRQSKFSRQSGKKGYVVITTALIVLFVTVGIVYILSFLSSGSAKASLALQKGEQALFNSDSCLEEGLLRLRTDPLYAGGEISFPQGTCHLDVNEESGQYTIQVFFSGPDRYWRSIEARVSRDVLGALEIASWEEKKIVIE
jgi:hypothetical protein